MGPMDRIDNAVVHNYYFSGELNENNLTLWMNLIAAAIIIVMFGVVV
jgi:ech hydrogenase subunit A